MEPVLKLEGIHKSFYGVQVLKNIDFSLRKGEVHVLLGENGAGKSTLIKILSGAYKMDSGTVTIGGRPVNPASYGPKTAEDLGIVTIYQNFHLVPHLSVAENIALRAFTSSRDLLINWKTVHDQARAVLQKINFNIDPRRKVKSLSVAQKQMLEIAIALSKNAKVIIMDEPTAALSKKEIEILFAMIFDIKSKGIGIIYISHKLEEIKQIGDRVTILRDGNPIRTLDLQDAELQEIIELMIGKELTAKPRRANQPNDQDVFFTATGIHNANFLKPLGFTLRRNEVLGITGLVGSGKTELARAIFGCDKTSGGSLRLANREMRNHTPRKAVKRGIGYLPEDRDGRGLCLNMGIKENMTLALLAKVKKVFFSRAAEKNGVASLIHTLKIKAAGINQQVKYLSGGNKQKVIFGKWLKADCKMLILDEPTIGIDVGAREEIYDLVREFVREPDKAVLFISSDMNEILEISDRILVMSNYQIVAELYPRATTKQEIMQYSMGIATH